MDTIFETAQVLTRARRDVFAFFASPRNLETITPPWLRFAIVGQSTPVVGEGTEFTYRLRLHGLPLRWRSRIEEWIPDERFVDLQLRGPYASWRHLHTFEDHPRGTLMRDRVSYRLPLGRLGRWAAGRRVARNVREIFDFRARRTAELLRGA